MKTSIAVIAATLYLILLSVLGFTGLSTEVCALMYLFSPLVIVGLVYVTLVDDEQKYPELGPGEEWGYQDKNKAELGIM